MVRFLPRTTLAALGLALLPGAAPALQDEPPTIHAATTLAATNNDVASRWIRLPGGLLAEVEYLTIEMQLRFWTLLGEPLLNPVARWRWEPGARIHILDGPEGARLVTFVLDENADAVELADGGQTVHVPRALFQRHARLLGFHYVLAFPDLEAVGARPTPEVIQRSYDGVVDGRPDRWGWNIAASPNWNETVARQADGVPVAGRPPGRGHLPVTEARRVFALQMRQCGPDAARRPLPLPTGRCEANGYERFLPFGLEVSIQSLFWEAQRAHPGLRERLWPRPRDRQVMALAGALAARPDAETPRRAELLRRTLDGFREELSAPVRALAEAELARLDAPGAVELVPELQEVAAAVLADAEAGEVREATQARLVALRERAQGMAGSTAHRVAAQAAGLERLGDPGGIVEVAYHGERWDHFEIGRAGPPGEGMRLGEVAFYARTDWPEPLLIYPRDRTGNRIDTVALEWRPENQDQDSAMEYRTSFQLRFEPGEVAVMVDRSRVDPDGSAAFRWGACSVEVFFNHGGIVLGGYQGSRRYPVVRSYLEPGTLQVNGPSDCVVHYGTGAIWFDPFAGR